MKRIYLYRLPPTVPRFTPVVVSRHGGRGALFRASPTTLDQQTLVLCHCFVSISHCYPFIKILFWPISDMLTSFSLAETGLVRKEVNRRPCTRAYSDTSDLYITQIAAICTFHATTVHPDFDTCHPRSPFTLPPTILHGALNLPDAESQIDCDRGGSTYQRWAAATRSTCSSVNAVIDDLQQ
jgi:hypothetical protein